MPRRHPFQTSFARGLAPRIALVCALLPAIVGAGCGGATAPRWPDANELTVALESAPSHFDPRLGTDQASDRVFDLLHGGLVTKDPRGDLVPDLAASWELLDEGRRYRFHLRPGLRFHDGSPLEAADVAWTFQSVLSGEVLSPKRGAFGSLEEVIVVDPATVDFRLSEPFSSFLIELTSSFGIVPRGRDPRQINATPVGAGPFRLLEHDPERLVFAPFDDHWRGRAPLERVIYRIVPDATVRALELLKGTVQLVVNDLPPDLVPRFRDDPHFQVVEAPGAIYVYLGLNVESGPLADPRVRRALALSMDRERLIRTLWRGLGQVTETMLPPGLWAHHDSLTPLPHDPAAAQRLLDEAGFPDPDGDGPEPRLRLLLKTSTSEIAVLQAQVLQRMVAAAGIDLEIRSHEFATFYRDVQSGNFELFSLARTGVTDPNIYRFVLHSDSVPPQGQNRGRYRNPELDRLLDEAAAASDRETRRALYLRAQEIVARDLPYISLLVKRNFAVLPAEMRGYESYLGGELKSIASMSWER